MFIAVEVARQPKAGIYAHGEKKKQSQFMITETASQVIDGMASELGVSRSELLERMIRTADIETIRAFRLESQEG